MKRLKKLSRAQFLREVSMGHGDAFCFTCGETFIWDHVSPEGVAARCHGATHVNHEIRELHEIEIIGPKPGAKQVRERLEREGRRLMKHGKTAGQRRKGETMLLKAEHDGAMAELHGLRVPPRELPVLARVTASSTAAMRALCPSANEGDQGAARGVARCGIPGNVAA